MTDSEIARDFFSDDHVESDSKGSPFRKMLTLHASDPSWQAILDDLPVDMMERLVEAYRGQDGRIGAIKILERRIAKRGSPKSRPKPVEPEPVEPQGKTEPEVADVKPWFPGLWNEARNALLESGIEPPVCYMCKPVFDALVNNTGIFDDRWGPEDSQVCKKENVVWHWNVCFCRRPGNERFRI